MIFGFDIYSANINISCYLIELILHKKFTFELQFDEYGCLLMKFYIYVQSS